VSRIEMGFSVEAKGATPRLVEQVHGREILVLERAGGGFASPPPADGIVTRLTGRDIHVFTADCIPLLFHGPGAVGAIHCGWRGALAGIASHARMRLSRLTPGIRVVMGPCILGCCFEVRPDLITAFESAGRRIGPYLERRDDRIYFHLDRFVRVEELSDVPDEAFDRSAVRCTHCSFPRLPSYRRDGTTDPRLRAWIRRVDA